MENNNLQNNGDRFERDVFSMISLFPGARAERGVMLNGKKVDILLSIEGAFGPSLTAAVECKDYSRPLTREQVSKILFDYYPLLQSRTVDMFYLVTENGIVETAKQCFDCKSTFHFTFSEVQDRIFKPTNLIDNMQRQFSTDALDRFYIDTKFYNIDLELHSVEFDRVYNDFMDYAVQYKEQPFQKIIEGWKILQNHARRQPKPLELDENLFTRNLDIRIGDGGVAELLPIIEKWIQSDSITQGIAILGTYGTGKSSFAKRLASIYARKYREGKTRRIPLLIELKEFGSHQSIDGLITHILVNKYAISNGSFDFFQELNKSGRFLVILDGFDEMKQGLTQDALLYNFNEINKLQGGRSKVILCGRPTIFESEQEQTRFLSGSKELNFSNFGKYIQIKISHFSEKEVFEFLKRYIKAKHAELIETLIPKIDILQKMLPKEAYLADLLSRPVHLPMFAQILPDLPTIEEGIINISRSFLYEKFILKTISREVLRLIPAYQNRYSSERRLDFASDLAVFLLNKSDGRGARITEIPHEMIRPYVLPGETIESTRRDLLTACFVERKSPDLFFFAHRSYAEFLVAFRLLKHIRQAKPRSTRFHSAVNYETVSFLVEMCDKDDVTSLFAHFQENIKALRLLVKLSFGEITVTNPGFTSNKHCAIDSEMVRFNFIDFGISCTPPMNGERLLTHIFSNTMMDAVGKSRVYQTERFDAFYFKCYMAFVMMGVGIENVKSQDIIRYIRKFPTSAQIAAVHFLKNVFSSSDDELRIHTSDEVVKRYYELNPASSGGIVMNVVSALTS